MVYPFFTEDYLAAVTDQADEVRGLAMSTGAPQGLAIYGLPAQKFTLQATDQPVGGVLGIYRLSEGRALAFQGPDIYLPQGPVEGRQTQ